MSGEFQIGGISGHGPADVNSDHQLTVKAITETESEFASDVRKLAFSWPGVSFDPGALDTIGLLKNTSTTLELHIDDIIITTDTDTICQIHIPTSSFTIAGTQVTGVNLNTSGKNDSDSDFRANETGNTQGDIIWAQEIYAASGPEVVHWSGALILAKDVSVGVDFVSAVTAGQVTITGHYSEKPD